MLSINHCTINHSQIQVYILQYLQSILTNFTADVKKNNNNKNTVIGISVNFKFILIILPYSIVNCYLKFYLCILFATVYQFKLRNLSEMEFSQVFSVKF